MTAPLNRSELAKVLGRNPSYVSAMAKAGMKFTCGRISLRKALAWMAAHPDFTTRDAYPRRVTPEEGTEAPRRKSSPEKRRSLPA